MSDEQTAPGGEPEPESETTGGGGEAGDGGDGDDAGDGGDDEQVA